MAYLRSRMVGSYGPYYFVEVCTYFSPTGKSSTYIAEYFGKNPPSPEYLQEKYGIESNSTGKSEESI